MEIVVVSIFSLTNCIHNQKQVKKMRVGELLEAVACGNP